MRIACMLLALLTALLLAACSEGDSGGLDVGDPSGQGSLLMTRPDGIVELSLESGQITVRVPAVNPSEFYLDVSVSPGGERIAYTVQPPPRTVDGVYDAGSDIWIANRDGSEARRVFEHVQPSQLARYPQWDGEDHLLAVIQEYREENELQLIDYTVQRIAIDSGERERLLNDALTYTLSPDGAELAYARLDPLTGEIFEVVDLPPGTPRTLVDTSERLSPFNSPRYAPDGERIAFAAADQRLAPPAPGSTPVGTPATRLAPAGRVHNASPASDGLPQDIWIIDAGGGSAAPLAALQEDFPSLTWHGDGTHIYVLGAYGLYDVNVENGNWTRIGDGAFHGSVAWAP